MLTFVIAVCILYQSNPPVCLAPGDAPWSGVGSMVTDATTGEVVLRLPEPSEIHIASVWDCDLNGDGLCNGQDYIALMIQVVREGRTTAERNAIASAFLARWGERHLDGRVVR